MAAVSPKPSKTRNAGYIVKSSIVLKIQLLNGVRCSPTINWPFAPGDVTVFIVSPLMSGGGHLSSQHYFPQAHKPASGAQMRMRPGERYRREHNTATIGSQSQIAWVINLDLNSKGSLGSPPV